VKRRWAEDFEQIPVALSAPHWLPVRRTKKIASIAARSGTRGLWQPSESMQSRGVVMRSG